MLALGKRSGGGGYEYSYTPWSADVDTSPFLPETRCLYESQEEALLDIAETSAYLRDNPTAEDAAERMDFLAALSNAVYLMRREYPDQWEKLERDMKNISLELNSESFDRLSAELDNLSLL